jgi:hypothetical protein
MVATRYTRVQKGCQSIAVAVSRLSVGVGEEKEFFEMVQDTVFSSRSSDRDTGG